MPWTSGLLENVPETEANRIKWLTEKRKGSLSKEMKAGLLKWYGEIGNTAKYAEAFEICEFGSYPMKQK